MASSIEVQEHLIPKSEQENIPQDSEGSGLRKSLIQRAMNQTFVSTAHLGNLLPTGTVLAFQLLCPLFSNSGHCDLVAQVMTHILIYLCSFSCILLSFTDSFKGADGKIYYGLATPRGLWPFDYVEGGVPNPARYRLKFMDVLHAFMSVMVFVALAFLDPNVVSCLYPAAQGETKEMLDMVPVGVGVISSLLFVAFPTTRHGIGFPVTAKHK